MFPSRSKKVPLNTKSSKNSKDITEPRKGLRENFEVFSQKRYALDPYLLRKKKGLAVGGGRLCGGGFCQKKFANKRAVGGRLRSGGGCGNLFGKKRRKTHINYWDPMLQTWVIQSD